ncbi:Hypothetical predicted protein [Pelobates cultripes]|uniref:Uncharacterized protein n=1 Tax=Pelobates cultripes TaxID=61616 RepID=A0AAD1S7J0_PELCU|nr:Hypothetical predicted protein [Pelobates cultripes]
MADATCLSAVTGASGDPATHSLSKLDKIFAAFWAKITERQLHTASTMLTTPANIPPETSSPTSGRRTVTTGGSAKRRRWRHRQNKRQRRARSQPHTHLRFKRPRLRTGAEATCPTGKRQPPQHANLYHQGSEAWLLHARMSLTPQGMATPRGYRASPEGIG